VSLGQRPPLAYSSNAPRRSSKAVYPVGFIILQSKKQILSLYVVNSTKDTAIGKGAGRRTVAMSGQERISDKELAQWVKQVEDNTPSKEKGASKPRPLGEMPKPNGQADKPSDPTPPKG
jgi:hypothetical protein